MTTATIQAVRVQRTLSAPPERVFDAWLDPEALGQFMRPGSAKRSADAVTDAREGAGVTRDAWRYVAEVTISRCIALMSQFVRTSSVASQSSSSG